MPSHGQEHKPKQIVDKAAEDRLIKTVVAERRRSSIQARGLQIAKLATSPRRKSVGQSKYPRRDVLLLKRIFDEIDTDHSGAIELSELASALDRQRRKFDQKDGPTAEERHAAAGTHIGDFALSCFEALDADGDGEADFAELLRLMYPLASQQEMQTMLSWVAVEPVELPAEEEGLTAEQQCEVRAMFALYDKDRSGTISLTEFRQAMRRCGCEDDSLEDTFAAADEDGNGEVDFAEWTRHMQQIYRTSPTLTDAMLYGSL